MNAIPRPGASLTPASKATDGVRRAVAVLALTLLALPVQGAESEPIAAVWKLRNIDFPYRSDTAIYSCKALQARVAGILRQVGARDDLDVKVNDCNDSAIPPDRAVYERHRTPSEVISERYLNRPSDRYQFVHVYVRMMLPTEVTPEVRDEMKRDKSRRELVSRVTGDPAVQFNDPVVFAAQWGPVTLSRKTIGLSPKECEMLDQMAATAFRELGLRVVHQDTRCSPDSRISPTVVLETLRVYEPKDAPETPAAGEEEETESTAPATGDGPPVEPPVGERTEPGQ